MDNNLAHIDIGRLLDRLAYSAARSRMLSELVGDDDDFVFDSRHELLRATFYFPLSDFIFRRLLSQVTSNRFQFFL